MCSNQDKVTIPKSWILIDSQSTVNVFSSSRLVAIITNSKCILTLYCNSGMVSVTQKVDLKGDGFVWYYPCGIENILSLYNEQKKHKNMYDSETATGFFGSRDDSTKYVVRIYKRGYSSLMLNMPSF